MTEPGSRSASLRRFLGGRSLKRQLVARFALVFLLVTVTGSLLAVLAYQAMARQTERRIGDDALRNLEQRFDRQQDIWSRNADEVKAQIDFMRIFVSPDQPANWLRLRAYFAAMEGKLDRFPSGVVQDIQGQVVFRYGPEGGALQQRLLGDPAAPRWFFSAERRTVYAVVAVPIWLGTQGRGRLVLLQAVDNGVLRQLSAPGVELFLMQEGRVLASSAGTRDYDRQLAPDYSGHLDDEAGFCLEQRVLPLFEAGPLAPRLVLHQRMEPVLSTPRVLLGSFALMAGLAAVLWLVLGRWVSRLARRVASLSKAAAGFARDHALGPAVERDLGAAQSGADEIGDVAEVSRALMQSVIQYDEERFAHLQTLDMLDEAVVELAADGRYLRTSPGWARLAGIEALPGERIFEHVHFEDIENLERQFQQLAGGEKTGLNGRVRLRRPDAKELWVEYRFISSTGRGGGVRGVLRDITQSYQLEKHVTHMALHDALTGLPNRVLLEDRCKMALRSAERSGMTVALGFLDLDHFKHVNDQFGHKTGDELLVTLSGALRKCLRSGDTLARWGGDEFVVLLPDLGGQADAEDAIAKLAQVCQAAIRIGDTEFNATFSMGVALYPADAKDVETLLSQSDRAMFAAKQQGRNTVRFFAEIAQREEDRKALYIQNRLATAIREGRIQAWFQPIVDARTHRVVSCEALARWHDETYGWVSPATFVPMAENLGLIRELGQQIWKQAIGSLHRWRQRGLDMRMTVNVSRRQLFTSTFTADLLEDLERLAIPVSLVDLEITESVAMEDAEHTEKRLAELSQAGFGIAIDDFGTGFSSLSQLHDMPATKIKIDISFVRRSQTEQGTQLIQAVVKIASAFGLQTVAEGVESAEIADVLTGHGVNLLQGYHFGKPMSADDFERHLGSQGPLS
jgi:diguanylate cyclase (GGDEF)-like protein/PAS domain S-box-containing protein